MLQRRLDVEMPLDGKLHLGAILVATGQITQVQLDESLRGQVKSGRRIGDELIESGLLSKGQIERGLFLQRKLAASALIVSTMLVPLAMTVTSAEAGQTSSMPVSATVLAGARIRTEHQVEQIRIAETDVARGYIDVPAATRFLVSTNSRSGYFMEFHPVGNLFDSVHIEGLASPASLGADGGTIAQRGVMLPHITRELSYRFILRPDTKSGRYQWPLQLSVRPI